MVSLTGDIATGQKVLQTAAKTLKRTHLELGGKAPVLVFDDADLEAGGRRHPLGRLLQCRAGLHGRLPHLCRPEDLRSRWSPTSRRRRRPRSTTGRRTTTTELGPLISASASASGCSSFVERAAALSHIEVADRRRQGLGRAASSTSRR